MQNASRVATKRSAVAAWHSFSGHALFRSLCLVALVTSSSWMWQRQALAQTTVLSSTLSGPYSFNASSGSATITGNSTLDADVTFSLEFAVDYLLVGGGGGGGAGTGGGGGGAGGFLSGTTALLSGTQSVVVGAGGAGGVASSGTTGENTSFGVTLLAGGGGGGGYDGNGLDGGSGGGAGAQSAGSTSGGIATGVGLGNDGGSFTFYYNTAGGGGGGAGAAGGSVANGSSAGGDGGAGLQSDITGSSLWYAGGGGGAGNTTAGAGGLGGGGIGDGSVGLPNTGGGGGGNGSTGSYDGSGGSGIAIIRYFGSEIASGGTVTSGTGSAEGYTLHTFTTTGTSDFVLPDLNTILAATLTGDLDGAGSLTFSGPGTLTLTGANSYSGGTVVDGGTLEVASGGSISHEYANLTVGLSAAGGGFNLTGGSVVNNDGYIGFDGGGTSSAIVSGGTWNNIGSLVVGFGSNAPTNGTLLITGGTVSAGYGLLGVTSESVGALTLTGGTLAIAGGLDLGSSGTGSLSISGSGVGIVGGTLSRTATSSIALETGGTLQIGNGVTAGVLATDLTNNGALIFSGGTDNSAFAYAMSGSGSVTTLGTGTLTFTGSNSYSGGTLIEGGALQIGDGATGGSLDGNVVDNGLLIFNSPTAQAFVGAISGTGAVEILGNSTLTLGGSNSYSGGTLVNGGTLSLGNADALGTLGTISFGGGTLQFTASNTGDYSSRFDASGNQAFAIDTNGENVSFSSGLAGTDSSLTKLGAGTLTLSGSSSYSGSTTVNGGLLDLVAGGTIGQPAANLFVGTLGSTGTLAISGGSLAAAEALIGSNADGSGGNGTVAVSAGTWTNSGTLTIGSAAGSYGTVDVSGGAVTSAAALLGSEAGSTGLVTVTGGSFTTLGDLTVGGLGSGGLTVSDTGLVVVGGTLSQGSGSIVLETGGTLQIGTGTTSGVLAASFTNNGTLIFNRSDDSTYSGTITGVGSVTKQGAGTLTLIGSNGWTGDTTIQAGALQIGDGTVTATIGGNILNNASLIFNSPDTVSYANNINGSGQVTKLGAGTLIFSGSNDYSAGTLINGGTLEVATGGTISHTSASLIVGDTGTGSLLVSGGTVLSGAGTIGNGATGDGSAQVTAGLWSTSGDLTVGANNAFGSLTIRDAGLVKVDGTLGRGSNGSITLGSGGTLQIGTGGAGGVLATDLVNNGSLLFNSSGTSSFGYVISGAGAVSKQGTGTLSLTASNSYTGSTTIEGGTLDVTTGGAVGDSAADLFIGTPAGSGTLALSGGSVSDASGFVGYHGEGTALVTTGTWANSGELRVGWGVAGESVGGAGTGLLTLSGGSVSNTDATLGGGADSVGTADVSAGTWTNSGNLLLGYGGGTGRLTQTDGSVSAANLRVGGDGLSSGTASLSGGILSVGDTVSVGYDGGSGNLLLTGGTINTVGSAIGVGANSIGVAEVSGGLWTTTGDMVVGSGGTGTLTMTGGSVQVEGTLSKGLGGTINLNAGGTLEIGTGGTSGALGTDLVNNGGVVFSRADGSTLSNSISGTGSLTKLGAGTLIIGSSNSYTGNTLINGGVLSLENTDALGSVGTISFAGGTLQFTTDNATDYSSRLSSSGNQAIALDTNYETVTFASGITGTGSTLNKLGFGTLILAGDNTFSGPTTISVGTLHVGDGGTTGSLAGDVVNNGSLVFNRSDASSYAGNISGAGSLQTIGGGRLELSGSNSFAGGTLIDGGLLAVGGTDALGSAGTISFGGGTLQYTAANTTDYSSRFSAAAAQAYSIDTNSQSVTFAADLSSSGGSLAKFGAGSLTLSGSNDLSGGVAINDGRLILGGADALGNSSSTIVFGGGILQFTDANTTDYSGRFSTADNQAFRIETSGSLSVVFGSDLTSSGGTLEKIGVGTLTLSGSNSLSGGFLLGGGVLSLGNAGALGDSGAIDFQGGTLQFSAANTADYSARFSTAANEAFSIDTNGQRVTFATGLVSSRGTLEKTGDGMLTLAGDSTYSGLTTISGGTLQIGSGTNSGSVAGNIANNASLVFNRSDAVGYAGDISGTGLLRTIGSGTLSLEGNNSYSGGTEINGNVLSLGSLDAIGNSGTISFGGGTLQFTAANSTDYSARFNGDGGQAFALDTNGQSVTLATGLSGAGSSLTKLGAGVLSLSGSSSYSSGTVVQGGVLEVVAGGTISHSAADLTIGTLDGSGTLSVAGGSIEAANALFGSADGTSGSTNVSAGSLALSGSLVLGNGSNSTGTLDLTGGSVTSLSGVVGAGTGSVGTATVGGGNWTMTGDLEIGGSGTGGLAISAGTVSNGNGSLGFGAGSVGTATVTGGTWANSGDLRVGYSGTGTLDISGGGVVSVGGDLFRADGSTITLGAGGTLQIGTGGTGGALFTDLANNGTVVFDRSDNSGYYGVISGTGGLTKQGAGILTLTGNNTYTGLTTISAGALQVGDGSVNGAIAGDMVDNGTLIFNTGSSGTFSGTITGSGSVVKTGDGTLTLDGDNSYSGGTGINGGILALGSANAIGTTGTDGTIGTISFAGGTLQFTAANTTDYSAQFNSSGSQSFAVDTNGETIVFATGLAGTDSSLLKAGSGTLALTGENTFTGLTTIAAGTLQIGTDGTSGSLTGDVLNSGELVFSRSDDVTFGGSMTGTGGLTKLSAGMLTLTGSNLSTGVTTISAGALQIGAGGTSGAITGDVVNNASLLFNRSDSSAYGGTITGSGSFTKLGDGLLTFTGTNSSSGETYINGGTLDVATNGLFDQSATDLYVGQEGSTGTLAISGGAVTNARAYIGYNGNGTVNVSAGTWTTTDNLLVGWNLSSGGTASIPGNGQLVISGGTVANTNAFLGLFSGGSGAATVSGGSWIMSDSLQLGNSGGAGTLSLIDGSVTSSSALLGGDEGSSGIATVSGGLWTNLGDLTVGSTLGTGTLSISGSGIVAVGGTLSGSGVIDLGAGGTLQIGLSGASGDLATNVTNNGLLIFNRIDSSTYSGAIDGSGAVTKLGAGALTLSGSNSYTGGTALEAGYLALGSADALGSVETMGEISFGGGVLQFTAGNTTDYSSRFSQAAGQSYKIDTTDQSVTFATGLAGSGGMLTKFGAGTLALTDSNTFENGVSLLAGTLQIGSGGTTGSIAGDIFTNPDTDLVFSRSGTTVYGGVVSGDGNMTKLGDGTLVLTGANTYLGSTTLSAGTLQIGDGGTTGSIRGDVNNGGVLAFDRSDDVTFTGLVSGTGGLTQLGAGKLTLTQNNEYTGLTTISTGTLQIGTGGTTGSIVGDVVDNGLLVFNRAGNITFSGAISGSGGLTQIGSGTLTLSADTSYTGLTTISAGTLQIGDGGTTGSIVGDVVNDSALVFNRSDSSVFAGAISGAGTVTKLGDGLLSFTGNSSSTGLVTVTSGTLQIGIGGTSGSIDGDDVVNNASLVFNRSDSSVYSGVISGSGSLTKLGAGTLALTAASAYDGGTTIAEGTLQLGTGGTTGFVAGDIVSNGTLAFDRSDDLTYSGTVSGSGGLTQLGAGKLTIIGENSYTGLTTISAGVLEIGDSGTIGSIAGDVLNDATLIFNRSDDTTFTGSIDGSGAITKLGGGTLSLTGSSAFAGVTTVSAGTLQIGTGGTAGTFGGTVENDSALVFNRSDDSTFSGSVIGTGVMTKLGAGTLSLTGDSQPGGGTIVSAGTLQIGGGGATGSLAGNIANDATLVFNRSNALTYADSISGSGDLVKLGAGTLALTGENTFTGNTLISAGTLQIGAGGTTGSLAGTITNNALLAFNRSDDVVIASAIEGSGGVTQAGAGTITLSASNSYTGNTTLAAGIVSLGNAGALGAVAADAGNTISFEGGTLQFTALNTNDYSARFSSAAGQAWSIDTNGQSVTFAAGLSSSGGTFTKLGAGTLSLTGENSFTGDTTVATGTLAVGGGGTTGSLAGNIVNDAALAFNRSDEVTYAGSISGTGTVTKLGAGVLNLTGNNTSTGALVATAGELKVNGSTAVGSEVTINSGAVLSGTGTVGGNTTIYGDHRPGNSPGIQSFTSDLTYAQNGPSGPSVYWELAADTTNNSPTVFDQVNVGGNLNFAATTSLQLAFGGPGSQVNWSDSFWSTDEEWTVYQVSGTLAGFSNLLISSANWVDGQGQWLNTLLPGATFSLFQIGSNVVLKYTAYEIQVPEIDAGSFGRALALLAGALGLLERRRRGQKQADIA